MTATIERLEHEGTADSMTDHWRRQQEEEAQKIRTRAAVWLRNILAAPGDNPPDEEEGKEIQALSVAAHLQTDRIPEAIFAHRVLLEQAGEMLRLHGYSMNTEYSDILFELMEYLTYGGYTYEDGEYRPSSFGGVWP
jgi:hypothetical protein